MSDPLTVRACPECEAARGLRSHTETGSAYARDPEAYARTDYTCKACGSYLEASEVIERPPESSTHGGGRLPLGKIIAQPEVTTWEQARQAFRECEQA